MNADCHRSGLVNMRIRVRLAYVFIGATYIAVICSILFGCHPMQKNWQIYPNPGSMLSYPSFDLAAPFADYE